MISFKNDNPLCNEGKWKVVACHSNDQQRSQSRTAYIMLTYKTYGSTDYLNSQRVNIKRNEWICLNSAIVINVEFKRLLVPRLCTLKTIVFVQIEWENTSTTVRLSNT